MFRTPVRTTLPYLIEYRSVIGIKFSAKFRALHELPIGIGPSNGEVEGPILSQCLAEKEK